MRRILALTLVAALGLVACGGGDDNPSGDGPSSDGTTAPDGSDDGNDVGNDDGNGDGDGDGTDSSLPSTGDDDLDALLARAASARVKVTYEDENGSTFILSQDPPRTAIISDGSRMVQDGDTLYICSDGSEDCIAMPGAAGGQQLTSLTTAFFGVYGVFLMMSGSAGSPFVDVTEDSSEEIAGRDARCVTTELSGLAGSGGTVRTCIDKETGVFLLGASEGGSDDDSSSRIEAVDFTDPDDADFEH